VRNSGHNDEVVVESFDPILSILENINIAVQHLRGDSRVCERVGSDLAPEYQAQGLQMFKKESCFA
jgi:hypothetical protein